MYSKHVLLDKVVGHRIRKTSSCLSGEGGKEKEREFYMLLLKLGK